MDVNKLYDDLMNKRTTEAKSELTREENLTYDVRLDMMRRRYKDVLKGLDAENTRSDEYRFRGFSPEMKEYLIYATRLDAERETKEWKRRLEIEENHLVSQIHKVMPHIPKELIKSSFKYLAPSIDDKEPKTAAGPIGGIPSVNEIILGMGGHVDMLGELEDEGPSPTVL